MNSGAEKRRKMEADVGRVEEQLAESRRNSQEEEVAPLKEAL